MTIKEATEKKQARILICVRCGMKKEWTDDNVMSLFGVNKSNQPFTTCCKCRELSNAYKKEKRGQEADTGMTTCNKCV
jgi:hypothetical protein